VSYLIVWTYDVTPGAESDFSAAYGPDGDWAKLFARAPGFLGTELYADGARFLTLDRWASKAAFDAFQTAFGDAYAGLDQKLAHLTQAQQRIGAFEG
jgi:heme-degrading monooxygenase HmoA